MNPEEAGVKMKQLSRRIEKTRHSATNDLFKRLEECVALVDSTAGFERTAYRARIEQYSNEARVLIRHKSTAQLKEAMMLLKMLQDLFAMYSWELYPEHDS